MSRNYILGGEDGKTPVEATLEEWAKWFETANRHVALTEVGDDYKVSTVFLGLDHRWSGDGPPILFETMIFGPSDEDEEMWRYSTWEEAERGHQEACAGLWKRLAANA